MLTCPIDGGFIADIDATTAGAMMINLLRLIKESKSVIWQCRCTVAKID
jgi:hypothetical protein